MMKTIRQEFADTMLEVGAKDKKLIVLVGDISHFILQPFAQKCPGRYYNVGICEPTIISMAAGLSKLGFHPVVHTIAPFIVERAFEQIKIELGYQRLGISLISVGSAFDYSTLGCTHHCYDDFALLKNIENMQIFYPGSCLEFNLLFKHTYNNGLPAYIRIAGQQHEVSLLPNQIMAGKGIIIKQGKNLTMIATGPQLKIAVESVTPLKKIGFDPEIIYLPTIKPLDIEMIIKSLKKTRKCLVIEEHSKYGGVFDDILRSAKDISNVSYAAINIGDKFIHEYGTYRELCESLGFSVAGILEKVKKF